MIENTQVNEPNQINLPSPTSLAEQGKLHALAGDHSLAMVYYRAAMQQTTGDKTSDRILSRYFAECALESFEHMRDFESVLAYCDHATTHYETHPPEGILAWKDLASIYQRQAIILIKCDRKTEAKANIEKAREISKKQGLKQPLLDSLENWLRSNFHIDDQRLEALLRQKNYYSITRATVNPSIAVTLPTCILQSFRPTKSS